MDGPLAADGPPTPDEAKADPRNLHVLREHTSSEVVEGAWAAEGSGRSQASSLDGPFHGAARRRLSSSSAGALLEGTSGEEDSKHGGRLMASVFRPARPGRGVAPLRRERRQSQAAGRALTDLGRLLGSVGDAVEEEGRERAPGGALGSGGGGGSGKPPRSSAAHAASAFASATLSPTGQMEFTSPSRLLSPMSASDGMVGGGYDEAGLRGWSLGEAAGVGRAADDRVAWREQRGMSSVSQDDDDEGMASDGVRSIHGDVGDEELGSARTPQTRKKTTLRKLQNVVRVNMALRRHLMERRTVRAGHLWGVVKTLATGPLRVFGAMAADAVPDAVLQREWEGASWVAQWFVPATSVLPPADDSPLGPGFATSTNKLTQARVLLSSMKLSHIHVIDPECKFSVWRRMISFSVILLQFILGLLFSAWHGLVPEALLYSLDGVYVLDSFVRANTGFVDSGNKVMKPGAPWKRYRTSWELWLDVVSVLPWELLLQHPGGHALRALRIVYVPGLWEQWEDGVSVHLRASVVAVKMLTYTMLLVHVIGCVWWALSDVAGFADDLDSALLASKALAAAPVSTQYLQAAYRSFEVITGGHSLAQPDGGLQVFYIIFATLCGVIFVALSIGLTARLASQLSSERSRFRERVLRASRYMDHFDVPDDVRQGVTEYQQLLWDEGRGTSADALISDMPNALRDEISLCILHDSLQHVPLFRGVPEEFLMALVRLLSPKVVQSGSVVTERGVQSKAVYFIVWGMCTVEEAPDEGSEHNLQGSLMQSFVGSKSVFDAPTSLAASSKIAPTAASPNGFREPVNLEGTVIGVLRAGDSFGSEAVLRPERASAVTIRAASVTYMQVLTYQNLVAAVQAFPGAKPILRKNMVRLTKKSPSAHSTKRMQVEATAELEAVRQTLGLGPAAVQASLRMVKWGNRTLLIPIQRPVARPEFASTRTGSSRSTNSQSRARFSCSRFCSRQLGDSHGESQSSLAWWRSGHKVLVHPRSPFLRVWRPLAAAAIVYNLTAVPLLIAFNEERFLILRYADIIADLVYILDIVVLSRTSIMSRGALISSPQAIWQTYLSSILPKWTGSSNGGFATDLVAALPLQVLVPWVGWHYALRIPKLLRVLRLPAWLDEQSLRTTLWAGRGASAVQYRYSRFLRLLMLLIYIYHAVGCAYWGFTKLEGFRDLPAPGFNVSSLWRPPTNWLPPSSLQSKSTWLQYGHCVWAVVRPRGVLKDLTPVSDQTTLFSLFTSVLGFFLLAFFIGTMGSIISNADAAKSALQQRRQAVDAFMRHRRVPQALQDRVRRYYDALWSSDQGISREVVIKQLPGALGVDLLVALHGPTLSKVKAFSRVPEPLLHALVRLCARELIPKGQVIYRRHEVANELFIVARGVLDLFALDPKVKATDTERLQAYRGVGPGSMFGHECLLRPLRELTSRTNTVVELLAFPAQDLVNIMSEHAFKEHWNELMLDARSEVAQIEEFRNRQLQAVTASTRLAHIQTSATRTSFASGGSGVGGSGSQPPVAAHSSGSVGVKGSSGDDIVMHRESSHSLGSVDEKRVRLPPLQAAARVHAAGESKAAVQPISEDGTPTSLPEVAQRPRRRSHMSALTGVIDALDEMKHRRRLSVALRGGADGFDARPVHQGGL